MPLPDLEQAIAASWFDLPDGGTQYLLPMSIEELRELGYIIPK